MKLIPLFQFSTLLLASACASVSPDEPDFAKSAVISIKGGTKQVSAALQGLSLLTDTISHRILAYHLTSSSGEAAGALSNSDFRFEVGQDEMDRLLWDINGQSIHIENHPQRGAVLKEIVSWAGNTPIRFVTNTVICSKTALKKDKTFQQEGFFIAYKGQQTEEPDFKGELELNFKIEGFQDLTLAPAKVLRTLRVSFQVEFDFEEAVELVPDSPKVSNLTMSSILWFKDQSPVLITQRITGARGPVRIKVLQTVARLKEE
jgi:hypothetical protein